MSDGASRFEIGGHSLTATPPVVFSSYGSVWTLWHESTRVAPQRRPARQPHNGLQILVARTSAGGCLCAVGSHQPREWPAKWVGTDASNGADRALPASV